MCRACFLYLFSLPLPQLGHTIVIFLDMPGAVEKKSFAQVEQGRITAVTAVSCFVRCNNLLCAENLFHFSFSFTL